MYEYKAEVKRIIDGDTYDVVIDLGFSLSAAVRLRLNDLDTPEIYRPINDAELEHGRQAKAFVESVMPVGSQVVVWTHKLGIYGRYSADVKLRHPDDDKFRDLAWLLRKHGFEKNLANYQDQDQETDET